MNLVSTEWLEKNLNAVKIFDGSWHMPSTNRNAIKEYEKREIPATFYIHSWELTPEFMPRIKLSKKDNFITYHNIEKAYEKMEEIIREFRFTSFSDYN